MRIKKLELFGFKSFKDRTVIQFDKGITGVVGPNGCGKSNIVDALIWVMGEMSAKHLRGTKMEDVIFAGSDGYAPMGVAEVSLVLENDGGPFPVKFANHSEIMITRRLHRSGESEYMINKEPSRLRDIQEIFMDTGAGAKGFSIIEQGAIGKIITAKPEERRTLIEEAAGITKFKARKRESLRKLEATDLNLVRLQDIIGELKRQVGSLERQAKRAQRYKELRDQAKDLDLWLSSKKYAELKTENDSASGQITFLQDQEIGVQAVLAQTDSELQRQRVNLAQKENDVNESQRQHFEAQNNLLAQEKEIMELQFRIEQARQNEKRSDSQDADLKARYEFQVQEREGLAEMLTSLEEEFQQAQVKYVEKSQLLAEKESSLNKLDDEISGRRREYLTVQQSQTHLLAQSEMKITRLEELNKRIGEFKQIAGELENKCKEFLARKKKTFIALESEKQLQLHIMQDVDNFSQNLQLVELDVEEKYKEVEGFKDELNQVISRLYGLEDLQANYEGFEEGVKTVLFWQKQKAPMLQELGALGATAPAGFQPVADVVEVPSRYEIAMEAALGSRLQWLMGKGQEEALGAIDYLKQENKGRSSFVTDNSWTPSLKSEGLGSQSATPNGIGVEAILSDVVIVPEIFKAQVAPILGSIAIVDTIRTALQLKGMYPEWSFVTIDGDTLSHDGIITGGGQDSADSGVLKRRREIKELRERKEEWGGKLMLAQMSLQKKEGQVKTLKNDLENATRKNNEKEITLVEIRKDYERAETESINAESALEKQTREVSEISTQRDLENEKLLQIQESIRDLTTKTLILEQEISGLLETLDSNKKYVEEHRGLVSDLRVKMAAKEQEVEGYRRQENTLLGSLAVTEDQISRLTQEMIDNTKVLSENQTVFEEKKVSLEQLISRSKEHQAQYASLRDEYEKIMAEIQKSEGLHTDQRKSFEKNRTLLSELQLKHEQLTLQEKYLADQILERYNVSLSERAQEFSCREGDLESARTQLAEFKEKLAAIGEVNVSAIEEFDELIKRNEFLNKQHEDLVSSKDQLRKVIERINRICTKRFKETFEAVNEKFSRVFPVLFGGGEARLILVESSEEGELGIEIVAKPPGKKMQSVTLMSGGEKALTAVGLIFAIFLVKPSPYCLLDEVDAPLDDANVARFNDLVKEMAKRSQIIVVTHNKHTMTVNDKLYGVTMEEKGISKMVSVSLEEAQKSAEL
ncbi:MAG: chromosome segregation protein SMC [Pseudomonadota bacterium]|nr:chromosome segregation protein SMC [Pseudomonadota bacterium]